MNFKKFVRRAAAFMAAMAILVSSAQAESFSAIVTSKSMKVYADEARTWNIASLPMATVVTVESHADGVAKITVGDHEGYAAVSDMASIASLAKAATVNRNTYVYQSASAKSKALKVKQGMALNVLATNGQWAMVENNGAIAYMNKDHLTMKAAANEEESSDESTAKATINRATYVYQKPSTSSKKLKVKKGMEVVLVAVSGQWAKVQNGSAVAYMNKDHLTVIEPEKDPEVEPDATDEDGTILIETFSAKVVADSMRVYSKADTGSTCLGSVKKGAVVTVHAYNSNGWAYIELNDNKGYAQISNLERVDTTLPEAEPTQTPSVENYINDESLSVEKRIFLFLTQEMGLNTAGACGVLANIEKESSFRVTAASYDGGYGIVQWTGGRNTRLKNWCKEKGYDYKTLEGQLWYLRYELEGSYKKILTYLKGVENSPVGAYDAGYYFCYNFEIPANRATRSIQRGNLAKDSYWQKYAG